MIISVYIDDLSSRVIHGYLSFYKKTAEMWLDMSTDEGWTVTNCTLHTLFTMVAISDLK